MSTADQQFCEEAFCRGLAPEPQLKVSDSAERYRILPPTSAMPGPWRNSVTRYLVEIMDCWSVSSPIEKIVLMKSAQVGGSEAENNCILHTIINAPGVMLIVSTTDAASRKNVRLRIDPMIDVCPALSKLVTRRRSRSSANTDEMKKFPGGMLFFVGSNSPSAIRSTPCRYILLDEVDAYPPGTGAGGEGDIVALAVARTLTFRGRRKIAMVSTPTLKDVSRIEKAFLEGDQRRYHVACPFCGTLQVLKFPQLRWPANDRAKAFYVCKHCGESVNEKHKSAMVAAGHWIATAEGDGKTASFHVNALISPFISWGEIALEHLACGDDPARLQVFHNTILGETWQDTAAIPLDATKIMARASSWGDTVPDAVAVITAGIDVQQNRLELEIVGWGKGEQSWSLEYHSLPGTPPSRKSGAGLTNC